MKKQIEPRIRKKKPGHGFWIESDYSFGNKRQLAHCSVCGRPSPRPLGNFCRWCGAHLDQEPLDLSSNIRMDEPPTLSYKGITAVNPFYKKEDQNE